MTLWFETLETLVAGFMALTPRDRWAALKRLNTGFMSENWFLVLGLIVLAVFVVLLVSVSLGEIIHRRRASSRTFTEGVTKRGLSGREREILAAVADNGGLQSRDGIFMMEDAFGRGAAKLVEQSRSQQGLESGERLMEEIATLREKLGFRSRGRSTGGTKISSRQIPVGKKLHLTRRASRSSDTIEATVIKNDAVELTVRLGLSVKVTFGEMWCVRYYFEASVWEFDTTVISYDGGILVLKHGDNVRFINRRRFVRVPVQNLAFIARFPFSKILSPNNDSATKGAIGGPGQISWDEWKPLEFVPAVVTELAGPGLRVEAPLDVKTGERILVVFKLEAMVDESQGDTERKKSRIIEDIGEVRRSEKTEDGFSIGIELVGLSDSDVGELIQAANTVSAKAVVTKESEAVVENELPTQTDTTEEAITARGA